jgi:Ricin-type beta-trefoil lectin domain
MDYSLIDTGVERMKTCFGILGLSAALSAFAPPGEAAQLVGGASGSCVNLPEHGGTAADGTRVRLFHCHDTSNQTWTLANGQINSSFGSCLDVQGSAAVDGAQVVVVTCNGRPSQKWSITNGQIIGIGGKCLDVTGSGTADTTPLIITTCSGSPSQQWTVQ